ncbi:MAG: hypothetical protein IJW92_01815 [Clostridia bacterium]|nr:hypothetical protein [Clostridia bacterium]
MGKFKNINTDCLNANAPLTTKITYEEKLTVCDIKIGEFEFPWVQGGCTDGKHLYEFMVSRDSLHCVIVKYDLSTQKMIAYSEDMMLGHANDGAYNPNNHTLAITHCCDLTSPTSNKVYIVDAETLTFIKAYELPKFDLFAITYNENTRQYITASESEMNYWDENFRLIDTKIINITPGWPSQGIECDGEYVYRLEFFLGKGGDDPKTMKNNVHVNDVETGKEIALIPLNMERESENMFIYNGHFYVSCNNKEWTGCEVYCFDIVPE